MYVMYAMMTLFYLLKFLYFVIYLIYYYQLNWSSNQFDLMSMSTKPQNNNNSGNRESSLGSLQNEFMVSQERIIKEMHNHVQNKEMELEELAKEFTEYKAKTKSLKDENGKLKMELTKLNKKLQTLQEALQEQMQKQTNLKIRQNTEQRDLVSKLKNYEIEISKMNQDKSCNETLKIELKQLSTQNKILKQINEKLQHELQRLQIELRGYHEEHEIFVSQNNLLKKMNEQNQNNFNNLRYKYSRLKDRLKGCEEELMRFQIQNKDLLLISKQNNHRLEKQFIGLTRSLKALEKQNREYQLNLKDVMDENEKLRKLARNYREKQNYQKIKEWKVSPFKRYFPNDSLDDQFLQNEYNQ